MATPLCSATSAGSIPLFGGFSARMGVSDFSSAWAAGLWLEAFPTPPVPCGSGADEISQLLCRKLPDMRRVSDRAGSTQVLRLSSCVILPSASDNGVGIPDDPDFAAQYLAYRFPLSTLRLRPHERTRMTRGRSDSLFLLRVELSSTISCQLCWRTIHHMNTTWRAAIGHRYWRHGNDSGTAARVMA